MGVVDVLVVVDVVAVVVVVVVAVGVEAVVIVLLYGVSNQTLCPAVSQSPEPFL